MDQAEARRYLASLEGAQYGAAIVAPLNNAKGNKIETVNTTFDLEQFQKHSQYQNVTKHIDITYQTLVGQSVKISRALCVVCRLIYVNQSINQSWRPQPSSTPGTPIACYFTMRVEQ